MNKMRVRSCYIYVILRFLSVNLFLCGHELASSFRLFSVHKLFLQMIKNFSLRQRLHFLLMLLYGLQVARTCHFTRKSFSASFKAQMCFKKPECPLEGKCLQTNVVYQATVTSETTNESYVGLATNFKDRYRNHLTSFRHANRRNETELS